MKRSEEQLIMSKRRFFIREVKKEDEFCSAPIKSYTIRPATKEEIKKYLSQSLNEFEKSI